MPNSKPQKDTGRSKAAERVQELRGKAPAKPSKPTKPKSDVTLEQIIALGVPAKYAKHVKRAIKDGLTQEDVSWNARLGRPPYFLETQEPKVEVERRKEWAEAHI